MRDPEISSRIALALNRRDDLVPPHLNPSLDITNQEIHYMHLPLPGAIPFKGFLRSASMGKPVSMWVMSGGVIRGFEQGIEDARRLRKEHRHLLTIYFIFLAKFLS